MICPLFNLAAINKDAFPQNDQTKCILQECAWWNEYFGKCSLAVSAYLKGIEDHRQEIKTFMRDRY